MSSGNIVIQNSGGNTTINQSSSRGIINWQSFNIGNGQTTHFNQPNGGVTLNRISPLQGVSQIYGTLSATGKIILINPAGIYFGPSAYVNVGGLIASTADLSDRDFLSGNYHFIQDPRYNGAIINQGTIISSNHGLVALIGNGVQNDGTIQANLGNAVLGSGTDFSISFASNNNISFRVNNGTLKRAVDKNGNQLPDGVRNTGRIIANGGQVIVSAQAARNVLDNAINMRGYVEARSAAPLANGGVILGSNDKIRVAANITATGENATGGNVKIEAPNIIIENPTLINVSGDLGGGKITIGQTADSTHIQPGVTLLAKALVRGNGGFVETSGHELVVNDINVDTRSANGATGSWLLDPTTITVNASLASTLMSQLASNNVIIQTVNDATSGTGDITFTSSVTWNTPNKFTVSAYRNILINSGVTIGGSNAGSSLALITNNAAFFLIGSVGGAITQTGTINSAGPVDLYYNPLTIAYANRVYTNSGSGVMTHWMYINNLNNFNTLRSTSSIWNRNFALNANLNLSSIVNYAPIGNVTTQFTGKFDGLGNALNSLTFTNAVNNTGIFGSTSAAALIKNLFIYNINFTGTNNVGGIVGINAGTVDNVGVLSGRITGSGNQVGGIIGLNNGTVSNASNYAAIIGSPSSSNVGGIIGRNNGTLSKSLSVGMVTGGINVGGLVGNNTGTVNSSFWDTYSTGSVFGDGINTGSFNSNGGCLYGCGSTTMSFSDIYTNAGWDFNNTWGIIEDYSYPYQLVRFKQPPQIIAGGIGQFISYLEDSSWAPMPQTAMTPDWYFGFENLALGNLRIDLIGGATGTYYDSTYSNADGTFYMLEQTNFFPTPTRVFQLQIGDSTYKSNTIFFIPAGRTPVIGIPLALNTVIVSSNGLLDTFYDDWNYQRFTNSNITNAFNTYRPNDILYTVNGLNISLKNGYNLAVAPEVYFDLTGNISTTNGSISFYGELSVNQFVGTTDTFNLTTNNTGNIYLQAAHWMDNIFTSAPNLNTLRITAANNILFDQVFQSYRRDGDGNLVTGGTLELSAAYTNHSIITGEASVFDLFNFNLIKGKWYQNGVSGPFGFSYIFNVANEFRINSGVMPATQAEFIRAGYGDGTPEYPYGVPDIYSLQGIGSSTETLASSWEITYDSVFNINSMIHWNDGKGFAPIGTLARPFTGTFNGLDLYLQAPVILRPTESYVGVFGATSPTATISNFRMYISPIQGNNYVGLVGYNQGTIHDITVTESHIIGNDYVGAIAGYNSGNIYNISTYSNRQLGNNYVGGIAGYNAGTISNVIVGHYIKGNAATGGIAGVNAGTIRDSFWDTDVTGQRRASSLNTGTQTRVYGGCLNFLCTNGGVVNLSNPRTYQPTSQFGYGLVNNWDVVNNNSPDDNHTWQIIPGYSYAFLNLQNPETVQVVSGKLTPGYSNQLLALFAGVTLGDNYNYTFVYSLVTGADGSFYAIPNLVDAPINMQVIAAIGSNVTGSVSYETPAKTSLNPSGSIKGIFITAGPNGNPSTNNLPLTYEQVLGLFSGYNFSEISAKLNPYNQNATFNNYLSYLVQYSSQLSQFYSSGQINNLYYYYTYNQGSPVKIYTNVDENIRSIIHDSETNNRQLLNKYDIQKISPNFCKI